MKTLRVGILGGTFDPVHIGHLHIAREVRRSFRLDEIWFLVARTPPHKKRMRISAAWHRCGMLAIATEGDPKFKICDYELTAKSGFTVDTMRALQRKYRAKARFYFIAGGDALRDFHKWRRFETLLNEFHVVFVKRPEAGVQRFPAGVDPRVARHVRPYRKRDAPWEKGSFLIDVRAPNVSSTQIRHPVDLMKMKKWVPPAVYQYIRKQRLYEKV